MTNAQRRAQKARPFPPDRDVRRALVQSGMGAPAVKRAMSQALRLFRCDFFGRRKRRLHNLAVVQMGMVQLKEKLADIATRHQRQTGTHVTIDDLSQGNYKEMLVDFGPTTIDRALNELVSEGIVRRDKRGITEVIRPTGKRYQAQSIGQLRQVLDQMKLSLNVRYARAYDLERTYKM